MVPSISLVSKEPIDQAIREDADLGTRAAKGMCQQRRLRCGEIGVMVPALEHHDWLAVGPDGIVDGFPCGLSPSMPSPQVTCVGSYTLSPVRPERAGQTSAWLLLGLDLITLFGDPCRQLAQAVSQLHDSGSSSEIYVDYTQYRGDAAVGTAYTNKPLHAAYICE